MNNFYSGKCKICKDIVPPMTGKYFKIYGKTAIVHRDCLHREACKTKECMICYIYFDLFGFDCIASANDTICQCPICTTKCFDILNALGLGHFENNAQKVHSIKKSEKKS